MPAFERNHRKPGSVLILRFFHGYFPNEIGRILRSPRSAVDNLLQTARREARAFKADPDALTFLHANKSSEAPRFSFGQISTDILTEVRDVIFQPPHDDCPKSPIGDLYPSEPTHDERPIDAAFLSHIVGCRPCLNHVNELLDLPSLANRLTVDDTTTGGGKKPKSGGGSGGGPGGMRLSSKDTFLTRSRKRLKQVFEHQPEELLILVNGFIIGSQRINSAMNELALSVNLDEKIGFIEVFSERNVCLLFQSVDPPPDGSATQSARVELSGGRHLELSLDFSETWPQLNASYRDPSFSEFRVSGSEFQVAESVPSSPPYKGGVDAFRGRGGSLLSRLIKAISRFDVRPWLRPERLTAVFALLLIATLVVWKTRDTSSPITVTDLLARTVTIEQQAAAATDVVFHKTINLEERTEQGTLLARRKIDSYQSGEQKLTVRRLYDEQGRILAGEWKRGDGSRTLYSNKEKPKMGRVELPASVPVSLDDAWLLEPSAQDFQRLTAQNTAAIVEDTPTYYTVAFSSPPARGGVAAAAGDEVVGADGMVGPNPRLINAKIVISKEDWRAIEQTLLIEQGNERREYRYTEASYQKLSPQGVAPSVFEPDRELLATLLKALKTTKGDDPDASSESRLQAPPEAVATGSSATADLEVEALNLLNQAGADTGEQVSVSRTSKGMLQVSGLVETDKRKGEILKALSPIAGHPAVRIQIMTVVEALAKEQSAKRPGKVQPGNSSAERFDTGGGEVPVKNQLQQYFGSEEAANNFASRMIGRSRVAMSRAGALKRLAGQFTLAELKELSPDARAKWLGLIRSHARAFQQETAALRQDLSPVFGGGGPGGGGAPTIDNDTELIRAVARLFELGAANDRTVRSALSISSDRTPGGLSSDFFRSLRTTEELAARISGQ